MAISSASDIGYGILLKDAISLYDRDCRDESITQTRELLADEALSRYHRIKALILLGSMVDWHEARECRMQAEVTWCAVRYWHPEGKNAHTDEAMKELREALDELRDSLEGGCVLQFDDAHLDEMPIDFDAEELDLELGRGMTAYEAADKEIKEEAAAEDDHPEDLLAPDARELNMTVELLEKLEVAGAYGTPPKSDDAEGEMASGRKASSAEEMGNIVSTAHPGLCESSIEERLRKLECAFRKQAEAERGSIQRRMHLAEEEVESLGRRQRMHNEESSRSKDVRPL